MTYASNLARLLRRLPQPVVNGGKQRALFGWHEAICARPMAQARRLWERMARSTLAAPEGKLARHIVGRGMLA